jgi:hypothetical protein
VEVDRLDVDLQHIARFRAAYRYWPGADVARYDPPEAALLNCRQGRRHLKWRRRHHFRRS